MEVEKRLYILPSPLSSCYLQLLLFFNCFMSPLFLPTASSKFMHILCCSDVFLLLLALLQLFSPISHSFTHLHFSLSSSFTSSSPRMYLLKLFSPASQLFLCWCFYSLLVPTKQWKIQTSLWHSEGYSCGSDNVRQSISH